jgi:hypothetical protein
MDQARQIERRIATIKQALADLGDMRPGSLSVQTRSWGGQYHQLSYTHLGKGRTEYIPQERLKDVKRQIADYRKFRDLTQEWVNLALELCKLKASRDEKE